MLKHLFKWVKLLTAVIRLFALAMKVVKLLWEFVSSCNCN